MLYSRLGTLELKIRTRLPTTTLKKRKSKRGQGPSDFRWFVASIFSLIKRFGNTAAWVFLLGYCAHEAAIVLITYGGRTTTANLGLRIAANLNAEITISLTTTVVSLVLLIRERQLHKKTRERLAARITQLELKQNPTRTSSGLTPEGLTRKEDL